MGFVVWLIIGGVAGWLAGKIMKRRGFGLVGNICVGFVGAAIGDWLLPRIGLALNGGMIMEIVSATIGAIILLAVFKLLVEKPEVPSGFRGFRPR
jgi:uncharacterized membrane protein YeaQ/YmgE (transglycosylase-associated protein family)